MKFVDEVRIEVRAGNGGAGSVHFRREKFIPKGGPDGGDGGDGGSVILIADTSENTLLPYRYKSLWNAESGKPGEGRNKTGRSGDDLLLQVPVGTQIYDCSKEPAWLIADLSEDGQRFVIAKGGRGGKGNTFFKGPTRQTPRFAQPGEDGESGEFLLSLKLLADVGLVGLPNAGKSTFLSRISAAKPKIADYPFTTLEPVLGVVKAPEGKSFVVADVPGLIPGAHKGKGLGITFLKHLERTKVIAHLVDVSQAEDAQLVIENFELIESELKSFSEELSALPRYVFLTKTDALSGSELYQEVEAALQGRGYSVLGISSVSGDNLQQAILALWDLCRAEL